MSILNLKENMKTNNRLVEKAKINDDETLGIHNAIRNFVEAKKGAQNQTDKGKKKGILVSAIKASKKK